MKRILMVLVMAAVLISGGLTAHATEIEQNEVTNDVLEVTESSEPVEYNLTIDYPVPVYPVNPDDYNGSQIATYAINGDVYAGSYNSTAYQIWTGILQNNVGKDYICFRQSQYEYTMFVGEDFTYSGGTFAGTGDYYRFNTYQNNYGYETGTDSFTIRTGGSYVFTNVDESFPALQNERDLVYAEIQTMLLIALLAIVVIRWIFLGR